MKNLKSGNVSCLLDQISWLEALNHHWSPDALGTMRNVTCALEREFQKMGYDTRGINKDIVASTNPLDQLYHRFFTARSLARVDRRSHGIAQYAF